MFNKKKSMKHNIKYIEEHKSRPQISIYNRVQLQNTKHQSRNRKPKAKIKDEI